MLRDIDVNGFNNLVKYWGGAENIPEVDLRMVKDTVWHQMSDEHRWKMVPTVEKFWRKEGFPFPKVNPDLIKEDFDKLVRYDVDDLMTDKKEMLQNNLGLAIANCFHPHKYYVKCQDHRPPYSNFENEETFRKVLFKTMKFAGNPYRRSGLRSILSVYSGTQGVSNFKPTVAKYIYTKYCPVGGKVLDPSLGYSGRLVGALSSHISHYEGCDPCVATFEGNKKALATIQEIESKRSNLTLFMEDDDMKKLPDVVLHNIPFEDYKKENFFDLVFTSPPYYNTEMYSQEETQSWKKYPKYQQWVDGFLRPLIINSYRALKKGGNLMLNIYGKVNGGEYCLEEDTMKIAKEIFGHDANDTIFMQMSKIMGAKDKGSIENRNDRPDHKIEAIFRWQKK